MRLLIATTNRGKLREITPMLEGLDLELRTLDDYPGLDAPEETGATFEENASLKARYYAAATGELTVAEDSGLEIDALSGAPGIESARFGGVHSSYPEKFALIYGELRAKPQPWTARFICAVALVGADQVRFEARGSVEGVIAGEPAGDGGFGYDPIFFYPPFGCTLAQAGAGKATVSHRAAAFTKLRAFLS